MKQKFTSGAEIYKWSNDLQVEQRFTSGADIYKWSRNLQVEQWFTSGAEIYKWRRHLQVEQRFTSFAWLHLLRMKEFQIYNFIKKIISAVVWRANATWDLNWVDEILRLVSGGSTMWQLETSTRDQWYGLSSRPHMTAFWPNYRHLVAAAFRNFSIEAHNFPLVSLNIFY